MFNVFRRQHIPVKAITQHLKLVNKMATNGKDSLKRTLVNSVLELEEIDVNLFRGSNLWKSDSGRAVFGGQIVGQALVAASRTKLPGYHVHSLHCYFVSPGRNDSPIVYQIDRTRDGNSFLNRTVKAVQRGETILSMIVSFHKPETLPISHQYQMPEAPHPDELLTTDELLQTFLDKTEVTERQRDRINKVLAYDLPIEIKPVDPLEYMKMRYTRHTKDQGKVIPEEKMLLWIRARGDVGEKDHNLHRCIAAYISDWTLLSTSLNSHGGFRVRMMASLDHSMWFHTNFRGDEWMLYESESPRLIDCRGLVLGRLWKQDGTLAVSVSQEGVIRGETVPAKL